MPHMGLSLSYAPFSDIGCFPLKLTLGPLVIYLDQQLPSKNLELGMLRIGPVTLGAVQVLFPFPDGALGVMRG